MLHALRGLTHQALFDLAAKHLTVSTVGASAAQIRRLADAAPRVKIALSHLGCISAAPRLHLGCTSAASRLHLGCTSAR